MPSCAGNPAVSNWFRDPWFCVPASRRVCLFQRRGCCRTKRGRTLAGHGKFLKDPLLERVPRKSLNDVPRDLRERKIGLNSGSRSASGGRGGSFEGVREPYTPGPFEWRSLQ